MVGSSKLKRAARKLFQTCGSFSPRKTHLLNLNLNTNISSDSTCNPKPTPTPTPTPKPNKNISDKIAPQTDSAPKNLCAICLDPLSYGTGNSPGGGQAIFTAQCSHAFHFACISSNVRHGGVTCPICRAHWSQLPRNLNIPFANNQTDPILQILDDSIATFRVHRHSFLRSARYDDDDPIEPHHAAVDNPRLDFALSSQNFGPNGAYLSVKLAQQPATDMVLVASPNGPHLRLIKQSMALVVFSLRPIDRLAIVTYSSAAARVFPLRRMTSYGKRAALQVIDRLFYMGQADPIEGLKKGVKILEDRSHENPQSCILHLSDSPTRSWREFDTEVAAPIHRFHLGFGFGTSSGLIMHEFEEFLSRVLGGVIRDIQLRIKEDGVSIVVRLGELRGGEERRVPLNLGECGHVCVDYSYVEGGEVDGCTVRTGEIVVGIRGEDKREISEETDVAVNVGGRTSSAASWDYHDTFMARRWAKHLHGYRM